MRNLPAVFSLTLALTLTAGKAVAADPMPPAAVSALAVAPGGTAILAGAPAGLFRSTDGGASWKQVMAGGEGFVVASLAFDPASSDVFAATTLGLFRSNDGGVSWEDKDLLGGSMPGEVVFDPSQKGSMYVASADGLYLTTNRGMAWKPINPMGKTFSVRGLAVREKPFTLYVINEEGLFASADRGSTWRALTQTRDDLSAVIFQPPATIHLSANGARYLRSVDEGKSWEEAASTTPHFSQFFVAGGSVYGATTGAMWRSTDGGKSWLAWKSAEELPVRSLIADPKKQQLFWAGSLRDGIMFSVDAGKSWTGRRLPIATAAMQASSR